LKKAGYSAGSIKPNNDMAQKQLKYEEAVREIEGILEEIEEGKMGVDELSEKVRRVSELLKSCRDKLLRTEQEIGKILGNP